MRAYAVVTLSCLLVVQFSASAEQPPSQPEVALTLQECYQLALARSEEIAIHQELIAETQGRFLRALGTILPHASFSSSDKRQDATGETAFTLRNIPDRHFAFSQPLFSGFKEFAAMAASRAEQRQRKYDKARAEELLLVDVSDAFYLLLQQQDDRAALQTTRAALMDRIEELRQRGRLGRSRPSEVVSAEAQLRRVEAELEQVHSLEVTARDLLEFLTGRTIGAIVEPHPGLPPIGSEGDYLARTPTRPDVHSAEEAWQIAKKQVSIAQAGFWPTVNVVSDYYTERAGLSKDIDWDVTLNVEVPIFRGGQTTGSVREASSRARQAQLRSQETRRRAELDIRDVFAKLQASLKRRAMLEQALEAAQENYRLQAEDYRLNLVNNLDVLQALQTLQDARRDVIRVNYEAKRLYYQLKAATGETL